MTSSTPRLVAAALLTALATGCIIDPNVLPPAPVNTSQGDRAPIIAALTHSPQTAIGKQDTVTFTVVASDPEGQPLQYNWVSTKGMLTANSGMTVGWRPTRADGTFEPGLSTVTLIVSDGRQSTTGSVNIQIDAQGQATVSETVLPSPAPSAAPATTAPVVSQPPSDDGAIGGKILFEDGFEGGLAQWTIASTYIGANWNPLTWKTAIGGAQAGQAAAVLSDGDDEVKPGTNQDLIWLESKQPLDLTAAVLPRLRLYVKNGAVPAATVKFRVFFTPQHWGSGLVPDQYWVGTAFQGGADWTRKEIDLSGLKGQAGYLAICAEVQDNGNAFAGPMVDAVTVYDAGK